MGAWGYLAGNAPCSIDHALASRLRRASWNGAGLARPLLRPCIPVIYISASAELAALALPSMGRCLVKPVV